MSPLQSAEAGCIYAEGVTASRLCLFIIPQIAKDIKSILCAEKNFSAKAV
jgi:hypothetical protein